MGHAVKIIGGFVVDCAAACWAVAHLLVVVPDSVVEIHREFCERGKREQSGVHAVGLHWIYADWVPCVISDRSDLLGERRPVRLEGFEERAWDGGSCRIRRSA